MIRPLDPNRKPEVKTQHVYRCAKCRADIAFIARLPACAYDPDSDYLVCTVDDGPPRFANISTRAIGRTYHEDHYRKPFGRPDVLVTTRVVAARGER